MTAEMDETLDSAFPAVDPGQMPLGGRVLVQLKSAINKTKSGIVLVEETKETVKWNTQVAKVIAMGPIAFRNRETNVEWPEGTWVKPGDFVRVPRWNGDRFEVADSDGRPVTFAIFNDHEMISRVTGDPLKVKAFVL